MQRKTEKWNGRKEDHEKSCCTHSKTKINSIAEGEKEKMSMPYLKSSAKGSETVTTKWETFGAAKVEGEEEEKLEKEERKDLFHFS